MATESSEPAYSDKRAQIMAGASRVFFEDGYEGASMNRIAQEAGVSKGTLYHYFPGKEHLFIALIEEKCSQIRNEAFSLDQVEGAPAAVLQAVGVGFVRSILHPQAMNLFRVVVSESCKFPELGRAFEAAGPGPGSRQMSVYLQRLCNEGILVIEDKELAAAQFIALCEAGALRKAHLAMGIPTTAEIERTVQIAVRVFLRGYAAGGDPH